MHSKVRVLLLLVCRPRIDPFRLQILGDDLANPSSSSSSTTCHLLLLPDELLDIIFRLVYALPHSRRSTSSYPVPLHSPLSRRLYRAQRPYLYRLVYICLYANLSSLCDTIRNVPGVGAHVEELVLDKPDDKPHDKNAEDEDEDDWRATADFYGEATSWVNIDDKHVGAVDPAHFYALLERLPRLKILRIPHIDSRLTDLVLTDERVPACIAKLEHLEVRADKIGSPAREPTVNWVALLARYPSLTTLDLDQTRPGSLLSLVTSPAPVLEALKVLRLSGNDLDFWSAPPLGKLAPNLDELYLADEASTEVDFRPALVRAPKGLRRLYLGSSEPPLVRPDTFVDAFLPRFTRLEHLTLGAGTFSSPGLLLALQRLPALHTLAFGRGAPVPDILLEHLVAGPLRIPSLHHLRLFHISCTRAPPIDRTSPQPFPPQDERRTPKFRMSNWWRAPRWPSGGTEAGLAAAIETARSSGISVEGDAVECVGWEADFQRGKRAALLLWGERTGDYVEARQELGHQVVEEHIKGVKAAAAAAKEAAASAATLCESARFTAWVLSALD